GGVTPLYPWNDLDIEVEDLRTAPPDRPPARVVHSPTAEERNWPLDEHDGLETVLLLARRTPLPGSASLAELIGQAPPAPLRNAREWALRGGDEGQPVGHLDLGDNRGLQKASRAVDDPLLGVMARLRPH